MLRGSRDFASWDEYSDFVRRLFGQLNAGRRKRFQEKLARLRPVPAARLGAMKCQEMKVGPSSTPGFSTTCTRCTAG